MGRTEKKVRNTLLVSASKYNPHAQVWEDKFSMFVIIPKGQETSTDLIQTADLLSRIHPVPTPGAGLHIHPDLREEKTKIGPGQGVQGAVPD